MQPLVLVPADTRRFDGYDWHCVPDQYLTALTRGSQAVPLMLPAMGEDLPLDRLLETVHGVLITGSRSNVHPQHYGVAPQAAHEPFDPARDSTTLPLIRAAIEKGVPLLAICRGIQELNVAFGGTLATEVQDLDGRLDHRFTPSEDMDVKFQIRHAVRIVPGSRLAGILQVPEIRVNSLHRQAIDRPAEALAVEATAEDGTIEAVSVRDAPGFALGVQWHPEYWVGADAPSDLLFRAFGDAARTYAATREK